MKFTKTTIEGVLIVEPEAKVDSRGYFERVYCHDEFKKQNINFKIVVSYNILYLNFFLHNMQ
jgi:dTDP-4-dehydrorhamnose 3,5-epimerase-like enzyme